jgi:hypothetical protein
MPDPIDEILYHLKRNDILQNLSTPIADPFQAQAIYNTIRQSDSLLKLKVDFAMALENKPPLNYNHPDIYYSFGTQFLRRNDKENAKYAYKKGAAFGMKFPCAFYNTGHIDSIGQCFTNLTIRFPRSDNPNDLKLVALGYIYLSRCIEGMGAHAFDSYYSRALLLASINNNYSVDNLVIPRMRLPGIQILLSLSDFFQTSLINGNPHLDAESLGTKMLMTLKSNNISYNSRSVENLSIKEITEYGQQAHRELFKILETEYVSGKYDLTISELERF